VGGGGGRFVPTEPEDPADDEEKLENPPPDGDALVQAKTAHDEPTTEMAIAKMPRCITRKTLLLFTA
jgi:hypothetical protein